MKARRRHAFRHPSSPQPLARVLPTQAPLYRRLLRKLPRAGVAAACALALLGIAVIYVTDSAPQPRTTAPGDAKVQRTQQLASTQPHVWMARVY